MDPKSIHAFPVTEANGSNDGQPGMTLRDHFAGLAMHQFASGAVLPVGFDATDHFAVLAMRAYECADAMLAAR